MVSRVLGLARDQVQAYYFGAGMAADAFLAAFRIPNLLRDLFAEGALSSAFVPTFTREREQNGPEAAWRLANRVITAVVVLLGALSLAILLAAPWILRLYAWGFSEEKLALATTMTRVLSPFLLFVALAAVAMGVLNTCRRFFLPALAPAWFNVCAILGILTLAPFLPRVGIHPVVSLAIGACIGGAAQFFVQVPAMRREGFRFRWDWAPGDPALRRVGGLMVPATFGLAATQINILVDTMIASSLGDGPIAWLQYAFRLIQLPIGLFGVAIATANLARVSRDSALGDMGALRGNLAGALRAAAFVTLPATAGLVVLREPIIRLLFEHGRFEPNDTLQTAAALLCYAIGLHAYAATKIQVPTYYALGDTRLPVLASATAITLKIAANFALLAVLPRFGVPPFLALALSTSLAAWTNFAILGRGLRVRLGRFEGLGVGTVSAKMAGIALGMGVAVDVARRTLDTAAPGGGLAGEMVRLGALVVLGGVLTGAGAVAWRIPEATLILARARDRFARRGDDS